MWSKVMLESDLSHFKGVGEDYKKIISDDKGKIKSKKKSKELDHLTKKILEQSSTEISGSNKLKSEQYGDIVKKLKLNSSTIAKFSTSTQVTKSMKFNSPLSLRVGKVGEQRLSFATGLTDKQIEFWKGEFKRLEKESPGGQVDEIKDAKKQAAILSKEWLVNPPFTTGICMGLAIDFIMQQETGKSGPKMEPSPGARFFERMLIPILLEICKEHKVSPDDITIKDRPELVSEVYKRIDEKMKSITGLDLTAIEEHKHKDLQNEFLGAIARQEGGHHALILENSIGGVAWNHVVYFNSTTRTIADGASGIKIKVPEEEDFNAVFALYIQESYGTAAFDKFSMFKVTKEEGVEAKIPSIATRTRLRAKIFALKTVILMRKIFDSTEKTSEDERRKPFSPKDNKLEK